MHPIRVIGKGVRGQRHHQDGNYKLSAADGKGPLGTNRLVHRRSRVLAGVVERVVQEVSAALAEEFTG